MKIRGMRCGAIAVMLILSWISAGCGGGLVIETSEYESLINSAWTQYNNANYTAAYQTFLQAKALDTYKPAAHIGCGWTLLRRQHPDSSIVVFRDLLARQFPDSLASYRMTSADSLDAVCGLAGAYYAYGNNGKVVDILTDYPVKIPANGFSLKVHDIFVGAADLELVQSMACYRLGWYSSTQKADPNNAVYHLNRVLANAYTYTTPAELMEKITEALDSSDGGLVL